MARFDPVESGKSYRVLRLISTSDGGSYPTEIAEELDISQTQASDNIRELRERNLIDRGKRTKAQFYEPEWQGIMEMWEELWQEKGFSFEDFLEKAGSDISRTEFMAFLENYLKLYFADVKHSTIKKMLLDDFYSGLSTASCEKEDTWLNELYRGLSETCRGSRSPEDYFTGALEEFRD